MKLFTSKKERTFWLWALATIVAIYSTLGLARPMSSFLREKELLTPLFSIGMLLMIMTFVVVGLKKRMDKIASVALLGVAGVYLIVLVRIEIPEERTHIIEYSVVATLIYLALLERSKQAVGASFPALLAIIGTGIVGTIDELIQAMLPSRIFDMRDILFNFMAGAMAILSIKILAWVGSRKTKENV